MEARGKGRKTENGKNSLNERERKKIKEREGGTKIERMIDGMKEKVKG